jgi:hypothetical protein
MTNEVGAPIIILAVFAEPHQTTPTAWEQEAEVLRAALSPYPYQYRLEIVHRCTPEELHRSLLRLRPRILHVQGHGTREGLLFVDRLGDQHVVSWPALVQTLADAPWLQSVVLNACDSYVHTQIGPQHFDLITTDGALSTEVSQAFTAGFYEALTARIGIAGSYSAGCNRVRLSGMAAVAMPTLTPASPMVPILRSPSSLDIAGEPVVRSIPPIPLEQPPSDGAIVAAHLRVCLAAEADVSDERGIALSVIDHVRYDSLLKGKVTFEIVGIDQLQRHGSSTASNCDLVVVLLWSRLSPPFAAAEATRARPDAAQPALTGLLAELVQAARDKRGPLLVIYRRAQKLLLDDEAPDFEERLTHKQHVRSFFEYLDALQVQPFEPLYNTYTAPDDFRKQFEAHLRQLVLAFQRYLPPAPADPAPLIAWEGSPFPGLRALTPNDAPIFFGRGRETDELLRRIAENRVVVVVGASGSGKSSLVGAGLLPRLADGAIAGVPAWVLPGYNRQTSQWEGMRLSPGEVGANPYMAVAIKLAPLLGAVARQLARDLAQSPESIGSLASQLLARLPPGAELLVFIDQFEELFTLVEPAFVPPLIALLEAVARSSNLRAVLTMRSDFYHRCLEIPQLAQLMESGQFPLSSPTDTLLEMITRPAERAGLRFEEGLPGRILRDTQQEPGALPLLAYALDELYEACQATQLLSHAAYDQLGGEQGAIG